MIQFSSVAQLCPTLCDPMDCNIPGLSVHHQLPGFTQTYVHWVSDAIQPSPPAFNLSQHQGLFKWVSFSHQEAKVLEFQLQVQSFQWIFRIVLRYGEGNGNRPQYSSLEYPMNRGVWWLPSMRSHRVGHDCSNLAAAAQQLSFKMDCLDLLAVQGTLKSLLQHHSSKASILWCSAFFIVQLSHPYMTNGKTIPLTRGTFVGKTMSLLFNMLSRLVITFLPRSKHLLSQSWLLRLVEFSSCNCGTEICVFLLVVSQQLSRLFK